MDPFNVCKFKGTSDVSDERDGCPPQTIVSCEGGAMRSAK